MYKKAVQFAPEYKICNLLDEKPEGAQVIITTHGKFKNYITARDKLDLSNIRVAVLDEAEEYFKDEAREQVIMKIASIFMELS